MSNHVILNPGQNSDRGNEVKNLSDAAFRPFGRTPDPGECRGANAGGCRSLPRHWPGFRMTTCVVSLWAICLLLLGNFTSAWAVESPSVAVLDSTLTRKFMPNPVFYSWEMDGVYQSLIDLGIPYTKLGDEDLTLEQLRSYKILILPGTKNMTPQHASVIRRFVEAGGKLLATGFASYRDDHDQSTTLHNNFQLSDLFGVDYLRYNPVPPQWGAIRLQDDLGNGEVPLGRNTSIQVHPHPGTSILGTWLDDDGKTPSAPETLDAAILENSSKTCIYVGENLFAPENSNSLAVKTLIADLLNRLAAGTAHPIRSDELPSLPRLGPLQQTTQSGSSIEVGLPFSPQSGVISSESPFSIYRINGSRRSLIGEKKNWGSVFHAELKGFRIDSGWRGAQFLFVPQDRRFPLKIVMWHPKESGKLAFKFMAFRGALILKELDGKKILVNRLPLEEYLAGVVSHEVPFYFHPHALEVMAVVARTFAEKEIKAKKFKGYDICATVSCQAYEGLAYESSASRDAVAKTAGRVLTYNSRLADLPYHATCGGILEDVEKIWELPPAPYLRSVVDGEEPIAESLSTDAGVEHFLLHPPDSFCKFSSRFRWKENYSRSELEGLLKGSLPVLLKRPVNFNHILDLKVAGRTPHGRVTSLAISTDQETLTIGKDKIRWLFSGGQVGLGGLQSTLFVILETKDAGGNLESVEFLGGGWGHGVGMCQFGAEGMARRGYTWPQILSHYFPGTAILADRSTRPKN